MRKSYAKDPNAFTKPPEDFVRRLERTVRWRNWYFAPRMLHEERIPSDDTRLLFVGYHTMMGFDFPYLWSHLYSHHNLVLRALTDKYIFAVQPVAEFLARNMGHVEGTRENCRALMERGDTICVYPGGSREALHPSGQAHTLQWGQRKGFVTMAMEGGYTIIPFAVVGIDDQWDYLIDGAKLAQSPLGAILKRTGLVNRDDLFPPIFRSLVPRPNRHYFGFGHPVATTATTLEDQSPQQIDAIRDQVADEITTLLEELQATRAQDKDRRILLRRFTKHR